jgi:hypothetical protein
MNSEEMTFERVAEDLFRGLLRSLNYKTDSSTATHPSQTIEGLLSHETEIVGSLANALKQLEKSDLIAMLRDRCLVELGNMGVSTSWIVH